MNLVRKTALFVAGIALCAIAWAGATRADAQAQVAAAIAHAKKVGVEQAIKEFNSAPEWKAKGMNLIVTETKGIILVSSLNERLIGKNMLEAKDPTGKEYVKEMVATAQRGEGWVDYQFMNPESKKIEDRSIFVRRLPGIEAFVGVAISK